MNLPQFLAGAAGCALLTASSAAFAGAPSTRFSCSATGQADFSMDAKYQERNGRKKFNASFESAPGLGFAAGRRLAVGVAGVTVGRMLLVRNAAGDIVGDLTFDSRPDERKPFPANFPNIIRGNSVTVGPLGCVF